MRTAKRSAAVFFFGGHLRANAVPTQEFRSARLDHACPRPDRLKCRLLSPGRRRGASLSQFLSADARLKWGEELILVRLVTPSWFGPAGALLLLSLSNEGRAEETRREIAARFSAPTGCGDREVLSRRFGDRVPELEMRFTEDAPVEFTIHAIGASVRARLLILLEEGGELSRTIEADDCEAAVEAIAFIAAVALDPGAVEPLQVRKHERLVPDKAVTRKTKASTETPDARHGGRSSTGGRSGAGGRSSTGGRSWTGGLHGRAHLGAGPDFLWGGGVSLENSAEYGGVWAPIARFALGYARRGGFEEEFGTARFALATAGLDLCPSQARGDAFRVQLCGTVEGGLLLAEGRDTFEPIRTTRPWFGLGPSIFSEIMIAGPVGLSYRGAAIFPLIRDAFRFNDTIFHEVPSVALELDAGLSVRF